MANLTKIPLTIPQQFKKLSYYLSIIFVLAGTIVLFGWITGIERLKSVAPHFITVKVNTAICFLLSGIMILLYLQEKKKQITEYLISLFALLIFTTGFLTLLEYYGPFDFGIDELFIKDAPDAVGTLYPGRQTPLNALFFLFFGLSFFPFLRKIKKPALGQFINLAISIVAFMTFVTYLFSTENSYKNYSYLITSFQSSWSFILLGIAAMFLRPNEGIMKSISGQTIGGRLFRRIFPFCLVVFLLLGWLVFKGEIAGYYISEFGISLFIISSVIVFTILLFQTAINLSRGEKMQQQTESALKSSEEKYRTLIEQASDAILIVDSSLNYMDVNNKAIEMFGYGREEFLQLNVTDITVMEKDEPPLKFSDLDNNKELILERKFRCKDGRSLPVEISGSKMFNGNYLAIVRDISERKKMETIIAGERQVLEMIATGKDIKEILRKIISNYEALSEQAICSILLLDEERKLVKTPIGPGLPDVYNKLLVGFPVGPKNGSCGTAAFRKQMVVVTDILSDPLWEDYLKYMKPFDMRACWSCPILDNEENVLGTFAIYYNEIRKPTEVDIRLIERAVSQAKIALTRHYYEIRIKENEEKFSKVFNNPGHAYAILNPERRYVDVNKSFEELIEYSRADLIGRTSAEVGMTSLEFVQRKDDLVLKLFTEGKIENIEIEFISRTEKEKAILLSVHSMTLNKGIHWLITLVCISEKKKAENALIASEEKYRTLIEQASDAIFITDPLGKFLIVNKSTLKLTQLTEKEILKMSYYDFLFDEDVKKHPLHVQELAEGKTVVAERLMKGKNGRQVDIEITAKLMANGNLLAFVKDITERKKQRQLLIDNEERLVRAESMGNLGHGYYDMINNTMHISAGLYKLFGVEPENFSHTIEGLKSVIHPEDYQVTDKAVDIMFSEGEVEVEFRIIQPHGAVRNVLFKTVITKNRKNQMVSSFTTALDITDRKEADADRQALLLRNEQTITSMLDGFILADDKGKIIDVNPAYCKMIGYRRDELLKKNINDLEATLTEAEIERRIKEMLEHKSIKFETKHVGRKGGVIDLEVSVSIMVTAGQPLVAAFVRDITEKKKVQEQIKNYNKQLSQLTAHLQSIREEERRRIGREIHDDLGQQLTAIKMDVAWIDKKTADEAGLIKEKLKNIIGLLDGSNMAVRRILSELKPSILDEYGLPDAMDLQARQFFENTGTPVEITWNEKNVQVEENVATCIFRVFQESLTNISRYARAKKVITTLHISDQKISISIKDDGIGFETSVLQTKNSFGVLGMHERVRALAGYFEIKSTVGEGTVVNIILPLKNKEPKLKTLPV